MQGGGVHAGGVRAGGVHAGEYGHDNSDYVKKNKHENSILLLQHPFRFTTSN